MAQIFFETIYITTYILSVCNEILVLLLVDFDESKAFQQDWAEMVSLYIHNNWFSP